MNPSFSKDFVNTFREPGTALLVEGTKKNLTFKKSLPSRGWDTGGRKRQIRSQRGLRFFFLSCRVTVVTVEGCDNDRNNNGRRSVCFTCIKKAERNVRLTPPGETRPPACPHRKLLPSEGGKWPKRRTSLCQILSLEKSRCLWGNANSSGEVWESVGDRRGPRLEYLCVSIIHWASCFQPRAHK